MNKPCTRFHTKTAQKPFPLRRHIPIWLLSIGEYPPSSSLGGVAQCRMFSQPYALRILFQAGLSLPWVPEVFSRVRRGALAECRPQADMSLAEGRRNGRKPRMKSLWHPW